MTLPEIQEISMIDSVISALNENLHQLATRRDELFSPAANAKRTSLVRTDDLAGIDMTIQPKQTRLSLKALARAS